MQTHNAPNFEVRSGRLASFTERLPSAKKDHSSSGASIGIVPFERLQMLSRLNSPSSRGVGSGSQHRRLSFFAQVSHPRFLMFSSDAITVSLNGERTAANEGPSIFQISTDASLRSMSATSAVDLLNVVYFLTTHALLRLSQTATSARKRSIAIGRFRSRAERSNSTITTLCLPACDIRRIIASNVTSGSFNVSSFAHRANPPKGFMAQAALERARKPRFGRTRTRLVVFVDPQNARAHVGKRDGQPTGPSRRAGASQAGVFVAAQARRHG